MGVYLGKNKVSTYIKEYNVDPSITTRELTVNPSGTLQEILPSSSEYFSKVIVSGDSYLRPENIRAGVSIYGVAGSLNPQVNPALYSLTVNPSTVLQTLTPPNGYDGFSSIVVNPVTSSIDSNISASNIKAGITILGITGSYSGTNLTLGIKNIAENGTFYASNDGLDGYSRVIVAVPNTGITPEELAAQGYLIPADTYPITQNGTYPIGQYANVSVSVPDKPTMTTTITPTTVSQTINPDYGKVFSSVTVEAIPSEYVIAPTGTYPTTITTNGNYDINGYRYVNVSVPQTAVEEAHNFVYSSTEPQNAPVGTIWFKPIE